MRGVGVSNLRFAAERNRARVAIRAVPSWGSIRRNPCRRKWPTTNGVGLSTWLYQLTGFGCTAQALFGRIGSRRERNKSNPAAKRRNLTKRKTVFARTGLAGSGRGWHAKA